ncbi:MAG: MFS transporter [Chlamydiota bacterium]
MISRRYAYIMFFMGILFFLYEYILRVSPGVMAGDLRETFQINAGALSVMNSMFFQAYVWMQIPVGIILDKYSTRTVLTAACFLCALGTLFFAVVSTFYLAVAGRLIIGLGASFGFVGALKIAEGRLPQRHFAKAAGFLTALGFSGAIFSDNVVTFFLNSHRWQEIFIFLGFVGIVLSVLIYLVVRDCHLLQKVQNGMTFSCVRKGFLQIVKNPFIWINGLIGFCYYFPTSVFAELLGQSYLKTVHNLSAEKATFAITMIFLGWAIGGIFIGWIIDRYQLSRTVLGIGGLFAAICITAVLYIPRLPYESICLLLLFFGVFSSAEIVNYNYARKISTKTFFALALGITNMMVVLGGALFQPLIGWILDCNWQGSMEGQLRIYSPADYKTAFWILPAGLIIGSILSCFLKRVECSRE